MNVEELTAPERRLWKAFPKGELVDLASGDPAFDDPGQAERWSGERVVRAEVLVALLAGAVEPEPGHVAAVRLTGARIVGSLNLGHAEVTVPLALTGCAFDEAPHLYWASMNSVHLMRCRLPGLVASGTRVDGHLWLEGSRVSGGLWLDGAHITGILNMSGVQLTNPGGDALYASRLDVAANVFCDGGFTARGEIRLRGARVGGYLSFVGAELSHPERTALNADDLQVETDVYCSDGFSATGAVSFAGARVSGQLNLRDARLRNENGTALNLERLQAEEVLLRPSEQVEGVVDLAYARINLLRDDPATWPKRLQLDGLQYENLDPPLNARQRLEWLRRDTDGYQPQPYERLAQTYRALGLDADGRTVLLAKARDRRRTQGVPRKIIGWLQDVLVGYGYRPFRAMSWLAGLLAFGTIVFSMHKPPILNADDSPSFNAFLYTLDLLLPVGDLGQERVFAPRGIYQWIANLLVAAGFVLGLTVAAGATRSLSRE